MKKGDIMNVGVIGLGYWGPNLLRNLYEAQLCEEITCCDLDEKKLGKIQTRYPSIHTEIDYQKLIQQDNIDAIVIATDVSSHYPLALESLTAGKHVFIEKPFVRSREEAQKLINLAEEKNLVIMVGHTFEFSPPIEKIKQTIEKGELGKVYYISASRVNLGLHQKDVSVIWDLAPHDFSMLFYWLEEEPVRIACMGKDYVQKDIPDVAFINLEFASGTIAHVQVSWLSPSKLRRTTIIGSEKMLVYDDTETIEKIKIYDKGVDYQDPESFGQYHLSYRAGDIVIPRLDTYEPLNEEMKHFIDCCKNNKTPRTDGYNGLRVVKSLEAAESSLRNNGSVVEVG